MPTLRSVQGEIRNFLGVNLRQDRLDLKDEELAKAINADLHNVIGTITLRQGATRLYQSKLGNLVVRYLFKNGNNRYQVAGATAYRNQSAFESGLSSFTTMAAFRPLNSQITYTFIADDNRMFKDDGTTLTRWGSTPPAAAPFITNGGIGELSGNYSAVYTYVRKEGDLVAYESGASAIPNIPVVCSSSTLLVLPVDSTDAQITHIRYYRTVAGGASYFLDTEAAYAPISYGYSSPDEKDFVSDPSVKFTTDSTDGQYQCCFLWEVDTLGGITSTVIRLNPQQVATNPQQTTWIAILGQPDSTLGAGPPTDSSGATQFVNNPPKASWVTEYQGSLFLCRDAANPSYLWYSDRFQPESFPAENFLDIGNPSDPLQCAVANAGVLGVFTIKTKYRVLGNTISGFVPQEAISHRGTRSPFTCISTEHGVIYASTEGVFSTNFIAPDISISGNILPLFYGETVNDMLPINWNFPLRLCATANQNRYYLAYPSGTNTQPDTIAVFAHETEKWYFYQYPWNVSALYTEEDTNLLTSGSDTGFVYIMEDGDDDDGFDISMDVETKDYFGQESTTLDRYQYFRVDADCQGETLTAEFILDGVSQGSYSITGNRTKVLNVLPQSAMGYSHRIRFTYSGRKRVKIYGVHVFSLPLGVAE